MKRHLFVSLGVLFALVTAVSASQLIDVDFNGGSNGTGTTATGAAVVGASKDTWNGFNTPPGSGPLVDASGAATSVSLTYSATGGWDAGSSPAPNANLMEDYLYQTSAGGTVDFSGLTKGGLYNVYVYSQNNDSNAREGDYTVNSTTQSFGAGSQSESAWVRGTNYQLYAQVVATGGAINITFGPTAGTAGEAELNGVQILAVPEPGSLVLLSLGLVCLYGAGRAFCRRAA